MRTRVEHICHAHIPQNKTSTTYVNNVLKEKTIQQVRIVQIVKAN